MRAIVLDRRFQNCSDAELGQLFAGLSRILWHHGITDWTDLPPYYRDRMEKLRAEFDRRGVQLQLFP